MKQYYISINDEQIGPLTFEELELKNISKDTLVWFDGITEWKKAHEIEELKKILRSTPPPINSFSQIPPLQKNEKTEPIHEELEEEPSTILGLNKKVFLMVALIVIIAIVGFYNYQANETRRIEQINNTTEAHNEQLELQQKAIEEQQARIVEQEKIEAQRRKEAVEKRLLEIRSLFAKNQQALEKSKRKLNEVTGFKLLRTSSERNQQIESAQNEIDYYTQEIRKLKEEFSNLSNNK